MRVVPLIDLCLSIHNLQQRAGLIGILITLGGLAVTSLIVPIAWKLTRKDDIQGEVFHAGFHCEPLDGT